MGTASDFNYKVALASGLRSLQSGKLRQAEEQFRYLIQKFPHVDGGYRGLAKVLMDLGDRAAALATLREGAGALAKAGERAAAIELLREAIGLDPLDLAVHRRVAAALALAGDQDAAVAEHARYVHALLGAGDRERARAETTYAIETLGPVPGIRDLAASLGIEITEASGTRRATGAVGVALEEAALDVPLPLDEAASPAEAEERAARLIAARDPRAGEAALEAARRFLAEGRTDAASDLLLQLVAAGLAEHEAQRLLVEVARTLGKRDVARAKCALLAQALRLDGHTEMAVEVERLAQAV